MGGGAAMRAAAKVAGASSFTSAFRNGGAGLMDNPVSVSARKTMRQIPATVCDGGGVRVEQSIQRPVSELDEWEFAGVENELFVNDRNDGRNVRVVFGPVPSIEETMEATSELKDALEKVYLSSPKSTGSAESLSFLHETESCITRDSVPQGAMQAFQLLNESPAVQNVVASIASDRNVWLAVTQNPAFAEFFESDRKETQDLFKSSLDTESDSEASQKSSLDIDNAEKPEGFMGLLHHVKVTVVDLVSNLSSFVESLFTLPNTENKDGMSFDSPKSLLAGGTFMALAMMVIMVVLMKRN